MEVFRDVDLLAAVHSGEGSTQRNLGLAEPHVATHQAIHRAWRFHVALHVRPRGPLVGRVLVQEGGLHFHLPSRVRREGVAHRRLLMETLGIDPAIDFPTVETLGNIENLADEVVKAATKRRDPYVDIPSRTLSNVRYSPRKRIIEMGTNTHRRQLFNLSQAKSYMQTILIGSRAITSNRNISVRYRAVPMRCCSPRIFRLVRNNSQGSPTRYAESKTMPGPSRHKM